MSCANLLGGDVALPTSKLTVKGQWSGSVTLSDSLATVSIPFLPDEVVICLQPVCTEADPATVAAVAASAVQDAGTATASFQLVSALNQDDRVVRYVIFSTPDL